MGTGFDAALRYLNGFKETEQRSAVNKNDFTRHVTAVAEKSSESGLSDDELALIVEVLINVPFNASMYVSLLNAIAPTRKFPQDLAFELLYLAACEYKSYPVTIVRHTLQWFKGLLDFDLVDKNHLRCLYQPLLEVTEDIRLQSQACSLLFLLTEPIDVTRYRSMYLLRCIKRRSPKREMTLLMSYYRSIRPDLLPTYFPALDVRTAMPGTISAIRRSFLPAVQRLQSQQEDATAKDAIKWKLPRRHLKVFKRTIIPQVEYLSAGHVDAQRTTSSTVLQHTTFQSLFSTHTVELPCHASSLLQNIAGHFLIEQHKETLMPRLDSWFKHVLPGALENEDMSVLRPVLKQIVGLQEVFQEGLPFVTYMLQYILPSWDGLTLVDLLSDLISFIRLDSVEDLKLYFLEPLQNTFMFSDSNVKCNLIGIISQWIAHLLTIEVWRTNKNPNILSSTTEDSTSLFVIIQELLEFGDKLCSHLIHGSDGEDLYVLGNILIYYEKNCESEIRSEFPVYSIPPELFISRILHCGSMALIARLGHLIARYSHLRTQLQTLSVDPELSDFRRDALQKASVINRYIRLYHNLVNRNKVRITSIVDHSQSVYHLQNHQALITLHVDEPSYLTQLVSLSAAGQQFAGIKEFNDTYVKKMSFEQSG